ncbi:peptide-methionine (R)-S-oxide reductase [Actinopolyspora lacussalsi]|nr:peptide-methionine (R)-S-oxide reductase [Actinopolyspora lacussalsi]
MDPVVGSTPKVVKSEQQWRERLGQNEYAVLRQGATEAPYSGDYVEEKTQGVYECRACGAELFRSGTKFESHCGWPSFWDPSDSEAVLLREDRSHGMVRVEVLCASCHSHLGHVFEGEGYPTPTDQRYCINSIALRLEPDENA